MNEFSRTERLIGTDGLDKLAGASVMVFGVGGVGSHCIEALARGGIGRLILVDHDQVVMSNINRQSIAYHSTIGQYKTKLMEKRIADISPEIKVTTYEEFVTPDNVQMFFAGQVDYVIDAIDTVTAKLAIIAEAKVRGIPVISSMGTGNKLHAGQFTIADIAETSVCPLCKVMRKELKTRGIRDVKVLYSPEKPVDIGSRIPPEEAGARKVAPGSVSFVPPVAGLLIAGEVIRELADLG